MIKILFMIPSLEIGGAQVFCSDLCREFAKREDVEIHLAVSFNIVNEKFNDLFENKNIHIHILEKTKGFSFKFLHRVNKLIKDINPDVINTHTSFTLRYLLLLPSLKHRNIIHTITNNPEQYNKKLFPLYKRRMHQKSWKKIIFVAISDKIAATLSRIYDYPLERIKVIYNGINPLIKPKNINVKYDFLNCGSLTDIKNQSLLIEAVHCMNNNKIKACIVGGGPKESEYRNQIEQLGLSENIILAGKASDPTEYYFQSKFFVLTSKTEGNPITILEALSAGIPVIAPSVGGIPDLIDDGINGFLFEPGISPSNLALLFEKALALDSIQLQDIKNNNSLKIKKWYIQNIADEYDKLFKEVVCK